MPAKKIIISGGGTGGHIFPAIAIANALKASDPEHQILFVGALGRMEMEKVPAAGYQIVGLPISGLQRSLSTENLKLPLKILRSLRLARQLIKDFRPDVVIGVGGYASGPMLFMASQMGITTMIQEQNSVAGLTNRLLSRRSAKIFVAYQGMEKFFNKDKIILAGNPVRQDICQAKSKRDEAILFMGLQTQLKTVLIFGGSLGARAINQGTLESLHLFKEHNIQVIWQVGRGFYAQAAAFLKQEDIAHVKLFEFIQRMDLAYAAADLVACRAGALSISELCCAGSAAILIPSPNVTADHQNQNALKLVENGAALLLSDAQTIDQLGQMICQTIVNPQLLEQMSQNIQIMALPNAAATIAHYIENYE